MTLGKYRVEMRPQGAEEDEEALLEGGRKLGHFLQSELQQWLGYNLTIGVGRTLGEAKRAAKGLLLFRPPQQPSQAGVVEEEGRKDKTELHPPSTSTKDQGKEKMDVEEGAEVEMQEGEEVEMAEYVCPLCKACFFEATDLHHHVEAVHRRAMGPPQPKYGRDAASFSAPEIKPLPQLRGNGTHFFTEALVALTDAQDALSFLQEMGAGVPVVQLPGWPPPT